MILVNLAGKVVKVGDTICYNGLAMKLVNFVYPSSEVLLGRVTVRFKDRPYEETFYPTAVGLRFVDSMSK